MKKVILGKKIGMSHFLDSEGKSLPVTVVQAGPCDVLKIVGPSATKRGSLLLGFEEKGAKASNKAELGFFGKLGVSAKKYVRQFSLDDVSPFQEKQVITAEAFKVDELVTVRGRSTGKGFAGTIKRYNFGRGPMTHGSKTHRIPGSIGSGTSPGRVVKGKRMAGHLGDAKVTVKNLKVVSVEGGFIFVLGAVPGKRNSVLELFN